MTQKVRKTLIMIVMAALIICLMAASLTYTFTYGRYAGGKFDEESPYDDLIEFVGANQYTVRTPEELIQAIEDGYSNIKIADDAEEPFVIDTGVTDVSANLVLDLNGTNVIRNSRNPLLDVKEEVSVVLVYDSAVERDETAGSFYNPVGSNLQVSGGTLTVAVGDYISGPKDGEYNEYNGTNSNHGTLGDSNTSVTLYARDNAQLGHSGLTTDFRASTKGYTHVDNVLLPTITPKIVEGETDDTSDIVYGNIYLDNGSTLSTNWLPADTFLLYTIEEDCFVEGNTLYTNAESQTAEDGTTQTAVTGEALTVACNVASCDFYYYYEVGDNPTTSGETETNTYAVIYGYWDVMKLAEGQYNANTKEYESLYKPADLVWPYGAVRMVESDNAAQDDNAAQGEGFARGGNFYNYFDTVNTYGIYAESGSLVASGNVKFSTGGEGVCIRCEGSASLSIDGGTYSSEIGNTIEMSGGNMTVTEGKFTKSAARSDGNDQIANQTAIIDIEDGTLKIEGKSANSVTLTAGSAVKNPDGTVTYSGTLQNVFGIRAEGGTVTTSGCTFNISGDYSAGVLSYNGTINLDDNTVIYVTQSNEFTDTNNNILLTSAGVSSEQASEDGEYPVNISGDVTITSNGLGITARGAVNVTEGESTVTTYRGTGIYVNNGSFTVGSKAEITVNSTVKSGYSWATPPGTETTNSPDINIYNGVYVQGGSLDSKGMLNVEHTGVASDANAGERYSSYAVSVESGNVTLGSGAIAGNSAGGIYVSGGELTAGAVTVSAGGTALNDTFTAGAPTYAAGVLVETGTVTLSGAKIYSTALGVAVLGGNFKTEGTSSVTATRATGIYVQGGTVTNSGTLDVTSDLFDDSGNLYESAGADFAGSSTAGGNIYNGIFVNGGSLVSEGVSSILNVTFRGAAWDAPSSASGATKSYAVYVTNSSDDGATETTNTYASIREGALNAAQAGGVYVHGGDVVLGAQYNENDEVVGDGTVAINTGSLNGNTIDTSAGTYGAGVFADNGKAVLYGEVNVDCAAIGIVAVGSGSEGDTVSIEEGAAVTVDASRATGIYVQGGTVTNSGTLNVTSRISSTWENEGADFDNTSFKTSRFNGIFVNGGSLESTGMLNVTFTGVQNDVPAADADGDSLFRTFEIKSYAVRVEAEEEEGTIATVTITSGNITNQVGGGVLVNGGKVTLGNSSNNSGPTVQTTGTGYHHNENDDAAYRYRPDFSTADNWYYYLPSTGGSAVKVDGGTLTVYGGDYSATQGDGIVTVNGTTTIRGGSFRGNDNYNTQYENGQPIPQAGPGASYAFKVYGGTAEVYGGTFGGNINNVWSKTSGAFVMGTSDVRGTANIYGGTFEVGGGNNGNEGGQAGFSIYQYATVNFAPQDGKKIFVNGRATAIAIEQTDGNSNSTVTISGGNFASTSKVLDNSDGIWYGNGSTTLNISSGTFTGAKRSGLWLDVRVPENGNVHLTGGTYYGNPVRSGTIGLYYWNNGGISAQSNGRYDGNGYWIGVNYIFDDGYMASCYYDDSYHDEYDDSALNQTTSRSERVDILQR